MTIERMKQLSSLTSLLLPIERSAIDNCHCVYQIGKPYTAKLSLASLRRFRAIVGCGRPRVSPVPRVYGGSEVLTAWWFCRNSISTKFATAAYPPDAHPCAGSPLLFATLASSPCGDVLLLLLLLLLVQPSLVVLVTDAQLYRKPPLAIDAVFRVYKIIMPDERLRNIFITFFKRRRRILSHFYRKGGFAAQWVEILLSHLEKESFLS